ncbi:hypothetical protein ACFO1B_02375 [Dactylosporangium siamense]|uniref:Uncharacterized protein n=1 Tax=Dactylosporangium siamense TaxID=685454 RepID=A0A919PR11_9ACTN|nr:hypothetical protein [Dactylosporangium siamense]GIG48514.1 hypothetical protein Dsi01nite_065550 [Dactylosporangium siamense]
MESDEVREQLALVRRAEAAPYIDYPPTPWWYSPAIGAWVAGMIGAFTWWRSDAVLFVGTLAALIVLELAFLTWMRRRHGALPMPGRGTPPHEIAAAWRGYAIALPVVVVVVGFVWWLAGVPVAAGVAFVLVTAGLAVYERRYAAAAAKVRSRLA